MYLIFDTETTGLPKNFRAPVSDTDNWPRCIQIAWQLHDEDGKLIEHQDYIIKPERFIAALGKAKFVVGQNIKFDLNVMGSEFYRMGIEDPFQRLSVLDTCTEITAQLCQIPGGRGGRFKLPTLTELH